MAYFRNNTVNLLNLHYGIHSLALSGGGAFVLVYLLQSGLPAPAVLASLALILLGRLLIRPSVLVVAKRFGIRPLIIAGSIATGLQYPLLAEVHGIGPALFVLLSVSSVGASFYWTTYHAYFASLGDHEHRGQQLGAREAIAAVAGIVGPLATGWALTTLGPRAAFDATAVVLVLAALPLFWTPDVAVKQTAPGALRAAIPGVLLFAADGWLAAGYYFVWQIALFLALGESFTAYGGAMALSAGVGAIRGLVLGRLVEAGHGRHSPSLPTPAAPWSCVSTFRCSSPRSTNRPSARRARCASTLRPKGAGTSAALLAAGVPIGAVILLSLVGVVAGFVLLRHYFARLDPAGTPVLVSPEK